MSNKARCFALINFFLVATAGTSEATSPFNSNEMLDLVGRQVDLQSGKTFILARNGRYILKREGKPDLTARYSIPTGNILIVEWSQSTFERLTFYRNGNSAFVLDLRGRKTDLSRVAEAPVEATAAVDSAAQRLTTEQFNLGKALQTSDLKSMFVGQAVTLSDGQELSLHANSTFVSQKDGKKISVGAAYSLVGGNIIRVRWSSDVEQRYLVYQNGENLYVVDKSGQRTRVISMRPL